MNLRQLDIMGCISSIRNFLLSPKERGAVQSVSLQQRSPNFQLQSLEAWVDKTSLRLVI